MKIQIILITMNGNYLLDTNIVIALFKEDQIVMEGIQEP